MASTRVSQVNFREQPQTRKLWSRIPLTLVLMPNLLVTIFSVLAANQAVAEPDFRVEELPDQLHISLTGKPIVEFVFRDKKILRPYFANARLPGGLQITRQHPPVEGLDAVDHDTMHPGLWLAFGDLSGEDFWRNKGSIEHIRFVSPPQTEPGKLYFATECRLKTSTGEPLCLLTNRYSLVTRPQGWLLTWNAVFLADQKDISFGDQEEMGFGARVATPFTEKNGGRILSSTGAQTAQATWGQPATWCDYSGRRGESAGGILLMASPRNFRESWWHNRDYGVFVANPFGRQALQQGDRSTVTLVQGEHFEISFGVLIHFDQDLDFANEYEVFQQMTGGESRR